MSRKPLPEGKHLPKTPTLNSLMVQLEDPRSLMSFLPQDIQSHILKIPDEYINLDEQELLVKLKHWHGYIPTLSHEVIRNNFWAEYDRVQFSNIENMMNLGNVYNGVLTRAGFYKAMENTSSAAYIITRSVEYKMTMEGLQNSVNRRFHDFLNIPLKLPSGLYNDPKLLELVLKTAAMIDLRNKGAYLQRSETKNLTMISQKTNHTYNGIFSAASNVPNDRPIEEIESDINNKLKELEDSAKEQLPPATPKFKEPIADAEFKEVDGK